MTRRRLFSAVVIAVLCGPLLPAARLTAATRPSTPWILVGGGNEGTAGGLGVVLYAWPATPLQIPADRNPVTQAEGTIAQGTECRHEFHYHGTLMGTRDDGTGCGWGRAVPWYVQPNDVRELSAAIIEEAAAQAGLNTEPPNIAYAVSHLTAAELRLKVATHLVKRLKSARQLKSSTADSILSKLRSAASKDKAALEIMTGPDGGTEANVLRAFSRISQAMQLKRQAFEKLAKVRVR